MKKDMLCYVQDVRAVKGMGQGLSDHHMILGKDRVVGAYIERWGLGLVGLEVRK